MMASRGPSRRGHSASLNPLTAVARHPRGLAVKMVVASMRVVPLAVFWGVRPEHRHEVLHLDDAGSAEKPGDQDV